MDGYTCERWSTRARAIQHCRAISPIASSLSHERQFLETFKWLPMLLDLESSSPTLGTKLRMRREAWSKLKQSRAHSNVGDNENENLSLSLSHFPTVGCGRARGETGTRLRETIGLHGEEKREVSVSVCEIRLGRERERELKHCDIFT